ncbi:hypothetical protein [[Kitasatospora] papulosa]|uniref:hypothetical protein n=1 Tax=[Kitasatospora] papulosa TaxID=1464011 RepID=UPI00381A5B1E
MDRFKRASAAALLTAVALTGAVGGAAAPSGVPAPPSGERAKDLAEQLVGGGAVSPSSAPQSRRP